MNPFGYLVIALGILVVILISLTLSRIKDRKIITASLHGILTMIALLILVVSVLAFSNLNTYNRLVFEKDIAEISIQQVAEQKFLLEFINTDQSVIVNGQDNFQLSGDEWRLDVRILKWKGWANIIGLDSYYQLERLSGRYSNIEQANSLVPSAYQLSGQQKGINIWKLKQLMKSKLPFLDAYFGQSVFVPMKHGARYRLSISQSGIVVRPANESANQALDDW